jgi:hypothetical protein
MDFNLENLSATITHPNFPEIKIHVEQPDDIQRMEYFTSLGAFTIPVAVLNPKDNTPIYEAERDESGTIRCYPNTEDPILKPIIKELQNLPVSSMVKFLKNGC